MDNEQKNIDIKTLQSEEEMELNLNRIRRELALLNNNRETIMSERNQNNTKDSFTMYNPNTTEPIPAISDDQVEVLDITGNTPGQTIENSKTFSAGAAPFKVNHSDFNGGFANKLLLALLAGFGMGVIATTIYIFINLGKFTFTL